MSGPPRPAASSVSGPPRPANSPISGPPRPTNGQVSGPPLLSSEGRDGEQAEREDDTLVESGRVNAWDRDFGGFGLGGRNGRFLFGGRNQAEPRPGLNGHAPAEVNGRTSEDDGGDGRTGEDDGPESRRAAAGWASVPTSTHPIVEPVSSPPTSNAPVSAAPVSPGPSFGGGGAGSSGVGSGAAGVESGGVGSSAGGSSAGGSSAGGSSAAGSSAAGSSGAGGGYGQPPAYTPALPDPSAGPVSGVPAPRGAASIPVPVPKPQAAEPAHVDLTFNGDLPPARATEPEDDADRPRRSASLEDAEPVRRGRRAAEETAEGREEAPLRPGDVAAGNIAFWDDDAVRHFRAAWHEVKAEFVDDPENALTRAHDLLTDAVNELTEALLAERDELDPLRGNGKPDTESMRMAMRGYREFLDRILAL
ncbi:hypothetical protein [Actinoplanes sp. URMC 104]|uniref:hypothetical protein n=1 Tax=Actinoplanes sp. URMC 104 TaxID=3423409 RepID=UPI003F1B41CF